MEMASDSRILDTHTFKPRSFPKAETGLRESRVRGSVGLNGTETPELYFWKS